MPDYWWSLADPHMIVVGFTPAGFPFGHPAQDQVGECHPDAAEEPF